MRSSLIVLGLLAISGVLALFQHQVLAQEQGSSHVLLFDPSRQQLKSDTVSSVSPTAATAVLCAATGLVPPGSVDKAAAADAQGVVQSTWAQEPGPRAVLLLHLAGVNPDAPALERLQKAWGDGSTVQFGLAPGHSAGSMLQAASDIVAANPDTRVSVLDHSVLQDCVGGRCLQHHLHKAMHHCGGQVHPSSPAAAQAPRAGLHGSLQLPGLDSQLDMQLPGVKLFALELAALQGSAQQLLDNLKHQTAEQLDKALSLYESTFVGLQALAAHFPAGSAELAAAEAALMDVLASVVTGLKGVYGDEVLYQVSFLGDAPVASGDASDLMAWKELNRRVLLQQASGAPHQSLRDDEAASSKRYAEKATAYGVTLLLIWFTFAGVYCMVYMPSKQDTLLYGRSKSD